MTTCEELASLSRKELQNLAKIHGIKANASSNELIAALTAILSSPVVAIIEDAEAQHVAKVEKVSSKKSRKRDAPQDEQIVDVVMEQYVVEKTVSKKSKKSSKKKDTVAVVEEPLIIASPQSIKKTPKNAKKTVENQQILVETLIVSDVTVDDSIIHPAKEVAISNSKRRSSRPISVTPVASRPSSTLMETIVVEGAGSSGCRRSSRKSAMEENITGDMTLTDLGSVGMANVTAFFATTPLAISSDSSQNRVADIKEKRAKESSNKIVAAKARIHNIADKKGGKTNPQNRPTKPKSTPIKDFKKIHEDMFASKPSIYEHIASKSKLGESIRPITSTTTTKVDGIKMSEVNHNKSSNAKITFIPRVAMLAKSVVAPVIVAKEKPLLEEGIVRPKPKPFDIKASLSKGLPYKPHSGKVLPLGRENQQGNRLNVSKMPVKPMKPNEKGSEEQRRRSVRLSSGGL